MWSSRSATSGSFARAAVAAAVALGIALAAAPPPARAAELWLDVSKAGERRVALALPPVAAAEGPEERTLREVLESDLALSGLFRLVPLDPGRLRRAAEDRAAGTVSYAAWASYGAELLLRVDATRRDGALVVAAALHDLGARSVLLASENRDAPGEAVRLAHTLADAVVRALTGTSGLALTRIASTWSRGDAPKRIAVMDYDGRGLRPVSADGVLALYPAWFPDGRRLAYVTYRQGRPEIVAHDLVSGQVRSVAFFPGLNAFPAISPDGRQMLLTLSRDGNPEIYRMAVDGSELKRLTFSPSVEASPAWSPDMTQVALVSDQGGKPQIHLLGANGGRLRRVSHGVGYATSPDWSPRGDRIVFTGLVEGVFQLFLLDPASGAQEQVTFDGENKESPSFARDGRHVVYSQGRAGAYRLYTLDLPSGERTLVTREKGSFTGPSWSP